MYSPRISEQLIPQLYQMAKARRMPMTRLVDGILRTALANMTPPNSAATGCSGLYVRETPPQRQAAA